MDCGLCSFCFEHKELINMEFVLLKMLAKRVSLRAPWFNPYYRARKGEFRDWTRVCATVKGRDINNFNLG